MGSVNDAQFLTDTTGNRRFLCMQCTTIDHHHNLSMDDVYRQAYSLYQDGFRYWFDQHETELIEQANETFMKISMEEESLLKYLAKPEIGDAFQLMTTTDISVHLTKMVGADFTNQSALQRLGKALAKHKFERHSTKTSKPFKVKLIGHCAKEVGIELHLNDLQDISVLKLT